MTTIPPAQLEAILNGPAGVSPDGVYQLDNPPNKNLQGLVAASVCLTIGTAMALMRAYAKVVCTRKIRAEDVLGLIGYISFVGIFINFVLLAEKPGLWVHTWDIRVKDLEPDIKLTFALVTCYCCTMVFMKAAVLLEWVHIFVPGARNFFFWTSYIVLTMNAMLYMAGIVGTWLTCVPFEKIYHPWVDGVCFNRKKLDETVIVFNLVFDMIILLLPQRVIWKLHTKTKQKFGVALIFSVGLVACACAAGRVYATFTLNYDVDATYYAPVTMLWAIAEGTCVLMIFCIPTAPKVFNSDVHLITKIAHSVRSWTRLPWGSRSGSQTSLPRSARKSSQKDSREDMYHRMDDPSIPLADLERQGKGIIHTKEFSTEESPNPGRREAVTMDRQHPWIQDGPAPGTSPSTRRS